MKTTKRNSLKIEALFILTMLLLITITLLFLPKSVTASIDGVEVDLTKKGETVEDTLRLNGIELKNSKVVPKLSSRVSTADKITVRYKKPVVIIADGREIKLSTYGVKASDIIHDAKVKVSSEGAFVSHDLDKRIPKDGIKIIVSNPKVIKLKTADGTKSIYTNAPTVKQVLSEGNIKVTEDDEISHTLSSYTKEGLTVEFTKIKVVEKTEHRQGKLDVVVKKDSSLPAGKEKVVQEGYPAVYRTTVELTYADDKLRDEELLGKTRVSRGQSRVVIKGTKSTFSSTPTGGGCGGWQGLLDKYFGDQSGKACQVMKCESGGNPAAENPRSSASGLFQFLDGTWKKARTAVKGGNQYSRAKHAPAEMQIAAAAKWLKRTAWSQWSCA